MLDQDFGYRPAMASMQAVGCAPQAFASNCLDLDHPVCPQSDDSSVWTDHPGCPLLTGCCTPEMTPRPSPYFVSGRDSAVNVLPQVAARLSELLAPAEQAPDEEQSWLEDEFSECGTEDDEKDLICWDFDIHAALLIRSQRDSNGYASSDASTAVSRSARRRRGKRLAKGKAKSESMGILESPPTQELMISEENKITLVQQLGAGDDARQEALSSLLGSVLRMSLEPSGCRVVQAALDVASGADKEAMVGELRGHVRLMVSSPHGNFVVQKVIEVLPVSSASFVAQELAGFAAEVAQHRFGCRVLSRLVEHHLCSTAGYPAANDLINELLLEVDQLIRHNFARHVLELILEHGSEPHKQEIGRGIRSNAFYFAKNRCASYVVEAALRLCSKEDTRAIACELLVDSERFITLAMHECGMHVVQAVVQSCTDCAQKARELLLAEAQRVTTSKHGKRLLEEMQ